MTFNDTNPTARRQECSAQSPGATFGNEEAKTSERNDRGVPQSSKSADNRIGNSLVSGFLKFRQLISTEAQPKLEKAHADPKAAFEGRRHTLQPVHVIDKIKPQPRMNAQQALHREKNERRESKGVTAIFQRQKTEIMDLRENLSKTQSELAACKNDLLCLQPLAQVPDSVIEGEFDSLCHSVTEWANDEIDTFETANPGLSLTELFAIDRKSHLGILLHEHPRASEYVIRCSLHTRLRDFVFAQENYMLGLSGIVRHALIAAENSMSELEPRKNKSVIANWRSETLSALLATETYKTAFNQRIQYITREIFHDLQLVLPALFDAEEAKVRLYFKVMQAASSLAKKVQTSSSRFDFDHKEGMFEPREVWYPATVTQISRITMVDLSTSKVIKSERQVVGDAEGNIGDFIFQFEPAIDRISPSGEIIPIRKAAWLIDLYQPLVKRQRMK
ncbi:uncharacterized protein KY384_004341 [Bacidia gigantensis]|uniref:uncharacterized protein n=1 Tax=Bacidia gigantensis TaxID=2732470 RepID=UPI001D04412E|nr:uncharacterized protein KY384_004341 [Bacidia gigantensis]KAG8530984.1 hypothetical protein KY384_004341 [Bacidia gigantensis]